MKVISLDELIQLGPGTLFVPLNVGGPAQPSVQVVTMVTIRRVEFAGLFPKLQVIDGEVEQYHHASDIRIDHPNPRNLKFVLIKDLEEAFDLVRKNFEELLPR